MIRSLALTVAFLLAGAVQASAQAHPLPHPPGQGHSSRSEHPALDSAQHALLHGKWEGTLSSAQGVVSGFKLSVTRDSMRNATFVFAADRAIGGGGVSNFMIHGDTLRWTQDLSGTPCMATAFLMAATPHASDEMKGTMACEHRALTFSLQKKTE